MAVSNLTGNLPGWEGQGLCERYYGIIDSWHGRRDCSKLIATLEKNSEPVPYSINGARGPGPRALPFTKEHGNCMIQVEAAGPDLPVYINIVPDKIISMAEWIFSDCVRNPKERSGGFVTSDLTELETYVSKEGITLNGPYPISTAFFTVTMTTIVPDWLSPGNWDPEMGYLLSKAAEDAAEKTRSEAFRKELLGRATRFFLRARKMTPRGQRVYWWHAPEFGTSRNTSALALPGSIDDGDEAATARRRKRT